MATIIAAGATNRATLVTTKHAHTRYAYSMTRLRSLAFLFCALSGALLSAAQITTESFNGTAVEFAELILGVIDGLTISSAQVECTRIHALSTQSICAYIDIIR